MAAKLTNERIIKALLTGCRATTKETVVIDATLVNQVLGLAKVQEENLFKWAVGGEFTKAEKEIVGSVIPPEANIEEFGYAEVDREHLLRLLEELTTTPTTPTAPATPPTTPPATTTPDPYQPELF